MQDDSWFYCKQVQEMPLPTLPGPHRWSLSCCDEGLMHQEVPTIVCQRGKLKPSIAAKVVRPTDILNHNVKI